MHWGANGASERMVVSPGNEREGIMQMPTGQSGHPLSPYYRNSHAAWASGEPTPFLPGPTRCTLTLAPRDSRLPASELPAWSGGPEDPPLRRQGGCQAV